MPKKKPFDLVHASPAVIRETKNEITAMERMLESDKKSGRGLIQDEALYQRELKQKKDLIEKHAPKRLRGKNQNKALARTRELASRIQKKIPSNKAKQIMYPKAQDGHDKHFDFERSVEQEMALMQDAEYQSDVREYKYLMERIDPSDPTVSSIERLREGRHVRIRR